VLKIVQLTSIRSCSKYTTCYQSWANNTSIFGIVC